MKTVNLISRSAMIVAISVSSSSALAQQVSTVPDTASTAQNSTEGIVVTGTRFKGMKAADSLAPITVLGSDALTSVGEPNLISSLSQVVPSFNAEAHGGDTGTLAMTLALRGLNPNDTLVLVNGKRRHGTANLHVDPGEFQGAASVDLDLIPTDSIDHIEILQDGAAAQYGTDAIAGVVNVILKHNHTGGSLSGTAGQYYAGDGKNYDISANQGFDLGGKGFLSVTGEERFRGFSQRTGPNDKVSTAAGTPIAGLPFDATAIPGFPNVGNNIGDPQSRLSTVFYNAEYAITPDVTLYSFGSYGHRTATANETYRPPNQAGFIALKNSNQKYLPSGSANPGCGNGITPASGINACYGKIPSGSYTTPGEVIFSTIGFRPQETLKEDDYSLTAGGRGAIAGWEWDLSATYGKDIDRIGTIHSGNGSIFVDTHSTPTSFYDGEFNTSELTGNLDVTKKVDIGLAKPLNIAFGLEGRRDTYAITEGEPDSYFGIGAASFPGFGPTNAVSAARENYAEYIDLATSPVEHLQIDIAGRHEHYTDFGNATVGKATARYDFSPAFAIRGTISSGFRAPTLAEEYYSQINVTPTAATVVLGPNSPGAQAEGIPSLKAEKSVNYSAGFVVHLWDGFTATVDGYRISINNRIVGTGTAPCLSNGVTVSQLVCNALIANGNALDPSVINTGTTVFTNGVNTRTTGVDATANYRSNFGAFGTVNWTAAVNWNMTEITHFAPSPAALAGITLQTPTSIANLTTASPRFKVVLGALWTHGRFSLNLRERVYGRTLDYVTPGTGGTAALPVNAVVNGANYYAFRTPTTGISDIEVSYALTRNISLMAGADNVFNKGAPGLGVQTNGQPLDASASYNAPQNQTPWGINGGLYYGRVKLTW